MRLQIENKVNYSNLGRNDGVLFQKVKKKIKN